jgi:PHP family Zn ribbon phosphoesterase
MPWCTSCDRFLSPSTVTTAGTCPRCGSPVDPGKASRVDELDAPAMGGEGNGSKRRREIPWHVKALLGVLAIYLGYRAFQGLEWLADQL